MAKRFKMLQEIGEQPQRLRDTLTLEWESAKEIGKEIRRFQPDCVIVVARGTSDNVATYARYLLQYQNHLSVASATPSLYTHYEAVLRLEKTLVIGISQSGETPDVVYFLKKAREQGALTCAVTNTENSPILQEAHLSLIARSGREEAVAATKTFTTSMLAIALLSAHWAEDEKQLEKLSEVPTQAEQMLCLSPLIEQIVQRYAYAEVMAVLSRGFCYTTALEIALKIRETALIDADGFSSVDFMHGPIAVVRQGFPLFLIAPKGKVYDNLLQIAQILRRRKAELIILSNGEEMRKLAYTFIPIPFEAEETLMPISIVIPGQLFAFFLALARNLNPDRPRGLRKVTKVW